ncbi:putative alkaline phosphatase family protein [Zalerion maritima]|uniref:Alkaline phosphatase family protein n=1 Tax=Zalerion maritima TaxID=339359 RepID=A0AAD5RVF8_9PEZI|nr:putative alkaline phosphatase family protein [Zalerion maritima]
MDVPEVSSVLLRLLVYVFLRWVPGHVFPTAIYTLFAIYVASYFYTKSNPKASWRSLVFGGRTSDPLISWAAFGTNIILVLVSLDLVYRAYLLHPSEDVSFVRIGYVSDEEVKFLIRERNQTSMPVSIKICVQDDPEDCANSAEVMETSESTDFTAMIPASFWRKGQTIYDWTSSNGYSGTVTSAPRPGVMPETGNFTFLSTSCIINHFPYNILDHSLAIPGVRHLSKLLPELGAQFMLFLGDFIYIDVPHRFGTNIEDYRRKYRQAYASPDMATVMESLPWIHILDDHEIANDWDAGTTGVYETAVDPYEHYHAAANPPVARQAGMSVGREGANYFEFTQGPAAFFMLDARSYRSPNTQADDESKTFLGAEQLEDFLAWIGRDEPAGVSWKVVASSVPFTKNWPVNRQDTWGGFLTERSKVLEAMWGASKKGYGFVILSGDRHEFAATAFPPPENSTYTAEQTVYEFSTSPLNQFASPFGTYVQNDSEDVELKYIPAGNSKVGAFTIFNDEEGKSSMQYRVFIDGVMAWNKTITAPARVAQGSVPVIQKEIPQGGIWDRLSSYFQ